MSLLTNFPEIDNFFKKQQFDNNELKKFIDEIKEKYSDIGLKKQALNLINLEILKYSLTETKSFPENNKSNSNIVKHRNNYTFENETILLNKLKNESIESISEQLEWNSSYIITILKQKNIEKLKTEVLKGNEFSLVKRMFLARLKALGRRKKELDNLLKSRPKKKHISLNKQVDVYTKISQNRGIGKVIYIRKK
jgi:hypothetical protein